MLPIILTITLACWCWLGRGPKVLRWPTVLLIVLFTSGHPLGLLALSLLDEISVSLLALAIMFLGLSFLWRGIVGRPSRRKYDDQPYHSDYRRQQRLGNRRDWHDG